MKKIQRTHQKTERQDGVSLESDVVGCNGNYTDKQTDPASCSKDCEVRNKQSHFVCCLWLSDPLTLWRLLSLKQKWCKWKSHYSYSTPEKRKPWWNCQPLIRYGWLLEVTSILCLRNHGSPRPHQKKKKSGGLSEKETKRQIAKIAKSCLSSSLSDIFKTLSSFWQSDV